MAGSLAIPVLTGIGNCGGELGSPAASPEVRLAKSAMILKRAWLEAATG